MRSLVAAAVAAALAATIVAAHGQDKDKNKPDMKAVPGSTPGWFAQVPPLPVKCEGAVPPDCPQGCTPDAQNKKCEPKSMADRPLLGPH